MLLVFSFPVCNFSLVLAAGSWLQKREGFVSFCSNFRELT
jgi:hypothetical protein